MGRRLWATLLVLAPAVAGAAIDPDAGRPHVVLAGADLRNAGNDTRALAALASAPRPEAIHLREAAEALDRDLAEARTHAARLEEMAAGDPAALDNLNALRARLDMVEEASGFFAAAGQASPDSLREAARRTDERLRQAWDALDRVAADFGARRELGRR